MATTIADLSNGPAKDGLLKNNYLNKHKKKRKTHARSRRTNKR